MLRPARHPLFLGFFAGPPILCLLTLAASWRNRGGWWWLVAFVALSCFVGIVMFTSRVNMPLNLLTESWTAATLPEDLASTRDAWNVANAWRAAWSATLFALSLIALYLHVMATSRKK